jgi:hypothetical protein
MKTFCEITGISIDGPKMLTAEEVEYIYLSCLNRQPSDSWRINDGHRLKEWLRICSIHHGRIAVI